QDLPDGRQCESPPCSRREPLSAVFSINAGRSRSSSVALDMSILSDISLMNTARTGRGVISTARLDHAPLTLSVARPNPVTEALIRTVLMAAFRHHMQDSVGHQNLLATAPKGRVGEIDLTIGVLEEHAIAREVLEAGGPFGRAAEIVECATGGDPL